MALCLRSQISCGVYQLYSLSDGAAAAVKSYKSYARSLEGKAFVIFSDSEYHGNGKALAKYIREKKLGRVAGSKPRVNPNTGRLIRVWVWAPDHEALKAIS